MEEKDNWRKQPGKEANVSDAAQWIRVEQVKTLYAHGVLAIFWTLLFSGLLNIFLWPVISHKVLILWFSCCCFVILFRYLLVFAYRRASDESLQSRPWGDWYAIGQALNGIVWGTASIWLFAKGSIAHQAMLTMWVTGLVGGALGMYSVMIKVYMAFTIPAMIPLILQFFVQGTGIHTTVGFASVVFTIVMTVNARRLNAIAISSLKLQFENRSLVDFLTVERKRTEKLNEELSGEIEEHRRTEEALRESEEKYRTILQSIQEGYYEVDLAGNLTFFNDPLQEILGYSRDELLGVNSRDFTTPETAERMYQSFNETYRTGNPSSIIEYEVIRKDGTKRAVEISSSLIREASGEPIGFRGVARDISERKHAEEAMQIERANLEQLFESAQEAIVMADNDGVIMRVNNEFTRIFGYTRDEAIGQLLDNLVASKDLRDEAVSITKRAARGERVSCETVRQHKDGTLIHVSVLASPIIVGDEQVASYGIYRDITAIKQAEEALRESEARYRSVMEAAPDPIVVYDMEGKVTYLNPAFTRTFGWTMEESLGRRTDFVPEEKLPETNDAIERMLQGDVIRSLETKRFTKDGRVLDVQVSASTFTGRDEKPAGNIVILRDVTEREKMAAALRESEERYRSLFKDSIDAICIAGTDGKILDFNQAALDMFGYNSEEMFRLNASDLYTESGNRLKFKQEIEKKGSVRDYEVRYRKKDGTVMECLESTTLYRAGDGSILGYQGIMRDMTERLKMIEALRRAKKDAETANSAKTEFLASMSHEIRTPMNAIIGMADLLRETPLTPEQQQYVHVFSSAGENLLNIINDILDISKVEAGHLDLEEIDFDLAEIVEKTCEVIAIRAHEKGLDLTYRVMPDVPADLIGDPVRLRQILINLIGNAIKFTETGEVVLEVKKQSAELTEQREEDVELLFSVSDTGIGIPTEKLDLIFESFTQADLSTARKHGGTGLGLTISKRLVELMGGRIWVESEVGEGSIFSFTVQFRVQAEPRKLLQTPPADIAGMKILVVDDNATNRTILREILSGGGALVSEVEDGEHGLAEIKHAVDTNDPYDLLLLDCHMPGMNGFEVAERIKRELAITDMIVMMLTSDCRNADIVKCKKLGIAAYLVKPIKRSDLFEAITDTISKTRTVEADVAVPESVAPQDLRPLHILLVEDTADNRLLIQSFLKKTPYQIDIAENGAIAVEKFTSEKYDLVLMDMQMPVMDGYTATREIRVWEREKGLNATPIVALTAYATKGEEQKSLDAGCNAHLIKPIKKAKLLEAISKYTR